MAAPYNPPVKNEDFFIQIGLEDYANPGNLKSNPTIAAGDFKVSKDGGALANLTTLPSVAPASSVCVTVTLSATEMNADYVTIVGIDQTNPKEWADVLISIPTTSA
jgi:hypothetical protein